MLPYNKQKMTLQPLSTLTNPIVLKIDFKLHLQPHEVY